MSEGSARPGATQALPAAFRATGGLLLQRVALNRVHPIDLNRNIPGLCWSWIAFNLNQIEGNPL